MRLVSVIGRKRPANEYAFAPMYRRRRIRKRRVASSLYGIYPPYANTKIDKREVLRRSLLWHLGVAPYILELLPMLKIIKRQYSKEDLCKGLRLGSYRTGILELYSIEKRTTSS